VASRNIGTKDKGDVVDIIGEFNGWMLRRDDMIAPKTYISCFENNKRSP
jgi:hypothetical protein